MTTPKPPTPQGISALLKRAGFERSTWGKPGVGYTEASTGFVVWRTFHRDAPQQPYVAVKYISEGMKFSTDEEYNAYQREARARLEEYAAAVRGAGYAPVVRNRGDEPPWLTVIAEGKAG